MLQTDFNETSDHFSKLVNLVSNSTFLGPGSNSKTPVGCEIVEGKFLLHLLIVYGKCSSNANANIHVCKIVL